MKTIYGFHNKIWKKLKLFGILNNKISMGKNAFAVFPLWTCAFRKWIIKLLFLFDFFQDCMYLHELGDGAGSFTKDEMQAGYVTFL